jgi:hypothetical protein
VAWTLANFLDRRGRWQDWVAEALTAPEQTYVWMWSDGQAQRKHLHFVVQPVTTALMEKYGGRRSEQLQAAMFNSGEDPDLAEVERFCPSSPRLVRCLARRRSVTSAGHRLQTETDAGKADIHAAFLARTDAGLPALHHVCSDRPAANPRALVASR